MKLRKFAAWTGFLACAGIAGVVFAGSVQGPVRGSVELEDGAAVDDIVVRLVCLGYILHGASRSDEEVRVVASGERFLFPWAWRGLAPASCSLRVIHPRYVAGFRQLDLESFAEDVGTMHLQTWQAFLDAGPTDPPMHTAYDWPQLELNGHLRDLRYYWLPELTEAQRIAARGYIPELHRHVARAAASGAYGPHPRLNTHNPMRQLAEIEDAVDYPGAQSRLFAAVAANDVDELRAVIAAGANVNGWDAKGHSALMRAAREGYTGIVEVLIDAGVPVDDRPSENWRTPLEESLFKGRWEVAVVLLERGAVLDMTPDPQRMRPTWLASALYAAAHAGDERAVRVLLEAGIPPDSAPSNGVTPLMGAAKAGQAGAARLLIAAGADVNACGSHNRSVLRFAQDGKFDELVGLLKAHGARQEHRYTCTQNSPPQRPGTGAANTENPR